MSILVSGGAGYIGSIIVEELVKQGIEIVVLDNFSQGHRKAVDTKAKLINADLSEKDNLAQIFNNHDIQAVIHLAADSLVGRSMAEPSNYFQNNVVYGMNLLNAMINYGTK